MYVYFNYKIKLEGVISIKKFILKFIYGRYAYIHYIVHYKTEIKKFKEKKKSISNSLHFKKHIKGKKNVAEINKKKKNLSAEWLWENKGRFFIIAYRKDIDGCNYTSIGGRSSWKSLIWGQKCI